MFDLLLKDFLGQLKTYEKVMCFFRRPKQNNTGNNWFKLHCRVQTLAKEKEIRIENKKEQLKLLFQEEPKHKPKLQIQ